MSSAVFDNLRTSVLALSESERAVLARDLVQSLDGPADSDTAAEWEKEINRRLMDIDSGTAELIDRDEFRRRIAARLKR
jgi:putative addiction module component (TIGR02574 family)